MFSPLPRILACTIGTFILGVSVPLAGAQTVFVEEGGLWNGYLFDTTPRTWDEARVAAYGMNFEGVVGNLVAITSANETQRIKEFIGNGRGNNPTVWIGLTDSTATSQLDNFDLSTLGTAEGTFQWVTGESTAYTNYNNGEPNNFGSGENAVEWPTNLGWNDNAAGSSLGQGDVLNGSIVEFRLTPTQISLSHTLKVMTYKSGGTVIDGLPAADALRSGFDQARVTTSYYTQANMLDSEGAGDFPNGPGVIGVLNEDNFAVFSTGLLKIDTTGNYTFRLNADDGQRLLIDLNGDGDFDDAGELVINDGVLSGAHNVDGAAMLLDPGTYAFEWTWYEDGGGAEGEFSSSMDGGAFHLIGDTANGGLDVLQAVPEPATGGLALLGTMLLAGRRRRK